MLPAPPVDRVKHDVAVPIANQHPSGQARVGGNGVWSLFSLPGVQIKSSTSAVKSGDGAAHMYLSEGALAAWMMASAPSGMSAENTSGGAPSPVSCRNS